MGSLLSVEDKGQEGSVAQTNLNRAEDLLSNMGIGGGSRVEIRFAAKGLPRKDLTSKSDPLAVLFSSPATGQTKWSELGRTNVVANSADPEWVRPVLAKAQPADGGPQPMRVVVYDADRRSRSPDGLSLGSQDYVGEAEFMMGELMAAPGGRLELPLLDLERGRQLPPTCVVVLKVEALASQDNRVVRMAFSAVGLPKGDVLSRSDPFLAGLKQRPAGGADDWVPTFRTEVRENNSDPLWQPIEVDIRQLCSANEQLPLRLQVWDFDSNGAHDFIGEVHTSLAALKAAAAPAAQRSLELTVPPGTKGGAASAPAPKLLIRQLMVREGPTPSQQLCGCFNACVGQA